ncbi:hypothetical protein ACWGJX_31265 [Streptomyces sp. NPDC054775]
MAADGLVPATAVAEARAHLVRHCDELKCDVLEVQKIDEAMAKAEQLCLAFCEATELYSGMKGNLN